MCTPWYGMRVHILEIFQYVRSIRVQYVVSFGGPIVFIVEEGGKTSMAILSSGSFFFALSGRGMHIGVLEPDDFVTILPITIHQQTC